MRVRICFSGMYCDTADLFVQRVAVFPAQGRGGEPRVVEQLRLADAEQLVRRPGRVRERAGLVDDAHARFLRLDRDLLDLVAQAVEGLFKVKVKAINTVTVKGKTKVFRGRPGVRSDWKKAIVSLVDGHKIDVTTGL